MFVNYLNLHQYSKISVLVYGCFLDSLVSKFVILDINRVSNSLA